MHECAAAQATSTETGTSAQENASRKGEDEMSGGDASDSDDEAHCFALVTVFDGISF